MKTTRIEVLSQKEIEAIHSASLNILSETGMLVHSEKVLNFLAENGADVDKNKNIVKFPEKLIQESLDSIPCEVELCDRNKKNYMTLGLDKSYIASGHNAVYVLDSKTGERKPATKNDIGKFAFLAEYLDNIDCVGVQAMPQDVMPKSTLLHAMDACWNNTRKHIYFSPGTVEETRAILDMAKIVVGADDLSKTPLFTCQLSSTSPLTWEEGAAEAVLAVAKEGVPLSFLPEPVAGVTAPITLAGLLCMHNTEVLSGIVLSQLARQGTPVIYGAAWSTFDMKRCNVLIGAPEVGLLSAAGAQMASFYKMPSHTANPESDSHILDQQNAWEKMITGMGALLGGVHLLVNAGMFATGLTVSFEQLVLDNEMFGVIKRFLRGIEVTPKTIAADVIKNIGPKGEFMTADHTLEHLLAGEHWESSISNRMKFEKWLEDGAKDVVCNANKKVADMLKNNEPPILDKEVQKELKAKIAQYEREISNG